MSKNCLLDKLITEIRVNIEYILENFRNQHIADILTANYRYMRKNLHTNNSKFIDYYSKHEKYVNYILNSTELINADEITVWYIRYMWNEGGQEIIEQFLNNNTKSKLFKLVNTLNFLEDEVHEDDDSSSEDSDW